MGSFRKTELYSAVYRELQFGLINQHETNIPGIVSPVLSLIISAVLNNIFYGKNRSRQLKKNRNMVAEKEWLFGKLEVGCNTVEE